MRVAFLSLPVPGHLNPMTALARKYQARSHEVVFLSLPETLRKSGAESIVLDQYQPYVELIPKALGMPYVHVSNALHVDYSGRSPLCFYGRRPIGSDETARNREEVERFRVLLEPTTAMARQYARKAGLFVDWKNPNSTT